MLVIKPIIIIIIVLSTLFIYGCASTSPKYQKAKEEKIIKEKTIYKSYDVVWQNVVDWFAYHNSPIKTLDKSSGLIASEYNLTVEEANRHLNCGKTIKGQVDMYGQEFSKLKFENQKGNFNVLIKKLGEDSTRVIINFFSQSELNQYKNTGQKVNSQKVTCYSKGTFENEIFNAISK